MKLRCENLVKKYGPRTVVKGVSMEVKQGEIVGFLGPNGAGKTTSFYMITGLIVPNAGKIYLDDEDITGLPMFKRSQKGVGYLAQEASVFRHMTVEDNIMSVMEMSKQFTKEERKARLESLLDEFNLHKVRKSKGIQLSGGERRRSQSLNTRTSASSSPTTTWVRLLPSLTGPICYMRVPSFRAAHLRLLRQMTRSVQNISAQTLFSSVPLRSSVQKPAALSA